MDKDGSAKVSPDQITLDDVKEEENVQPEPEQEENPFSDSADLLD